MLEIEEQTANDGKEKRDEMQALTWLPMRLQILCIIPDNIIQFQFHNLSNKEKVPYN